jgi:hypothetical protein
MDGKEGCDQANPYVKLGDDADAAVLGVRNKTGDVRLQATNE